MNIESLVLVGNFKMLIVLCAVYIDTVEAVNGHTTGEIEVGGIDGRVGTPVGVLADGGLCVGRTHTHGQHRSDASIHRTVEVDFELMRTHTQRDNAVELILRIVAIHFNLPYNAVSQ